jgi:hypothetical protein
MRKGCGDASGFGSAVCPFAIAAMPSTFPAPHSGNIIRYGYRCGYNVLTVIAAVHHMGIVHRGACFDINSHLQMSSRIIWCALDSKCLLWQLVTADDVLKVSDFGISEFIGVGQKRQEGSPAFLAPECISTNI